jgi:integrase
MATKPRRRQRGEGSISEYTTTAGPRFLIKYSEPQPDGSTKQRLRRGFLDRKSAAAALGNINADVRRGAYLTPTDTTLGEWLEEWLGGLRLSPSSMASYRKNVRLHVVPYLGGVPLVKLTGPQLTAMYRTLEKSGRADHEKGAPLSARSVRYVHTIVKAALKSAVEHGKLAKNPAALASPPSAAEAKAPEMHPWTGAQLSTFLRWAWEQRSDIAPAWHVLAFTGMRRGELLALRWGDVYLDTGRISVCRSLTPVRVTGEGLSLIYGPTKGKCDRVVDVDPETMRILRTHRQTRGSLALALVRDDALVFANEEGDCLHPDRFTRRFTESLASCGRALGADVVPPIRLHDLRHTHASLLLQAGVNIKVVSERLGHASVNITWNVYQHVAPGMQQEAAAKFAALVGGAL